MPLASGRLQSLQVDPGEGERVVHMSTFRATAALLFLAQSPNSYVYVVIVTRWLRTGVLAYSDQSSNIKPPPTFSSWLSALLLPAELRLRLRLRDLLDELPEPLLPLSSRASHGLGQRWFIPSQLIYRPPEQMFVIHCGSVRKHHNNRTWSHRGVCSASAQSYNGSRSGTRAGMPTDGLTHCHVILSHLISGYGA